MSDPRHDVRRLLDAVAAQAPFLPPSVVPRQFLDLSVSDLFESGVKLREVNEVLHEEEAAARVRLGLGSDAEAPRLVLLSLVDLDRMQFCVMGLKYVSRAERILRDIDTFLEYQLKRKARDELEELSELFLTENGHNGGDVHIVQECYTAAYAAKVLLSNISGFSVVVAGKRKAAPLKKELLPGVVKELFAWARDNDNAAATARAKATKKRRKASRGDSLDVTGDTGEKGDAVTEPSTSTQTPRGRSGGGSSTSSGKKKRKRQRSHRKATDAVSS